MERNVIFFQYMFSALHDSARAFDLAKKPLEKMSGGDDQGDECLLRKKFEENIQGLFKQKVRGISEG